MKKKTRESHHEHSHSKGVVFVTRRGVGYIKDERFPQDIEIENQHMSTALSGDIVCVELLGKKNNRMQGRIEEVLERNKTKFVGILEKDGDEYSLKPDNKKIHVDIALAKKEVEGLKLGTKLYVEIEEWTNPRKNPRAHVLEVIGQAGEHEVEMQSIIYEHGFDATFPRRLEDEALHIAKEKEITETDLKERRDMRGVTTFTIDPHDAKDFDDALSIAYKDNGDVEIGVHIADVTYYVRPGSGLEDEAKYRATSIYLVDRTIPMLPEILSNDVCSLNPNEDRRTFSAIFVLDNQGGVKERWFGETIIHSNKRFSYEEAQEVLNKGEGLLYRELKTMDTLAKSIRKQRTANGAVTFEQDEVAFDLDKKGVPTRIYKKQRQDTNKMIEDFMLLANEEVATYMYEQVKKTPGKDNVFIYRIHDAPDPSRIEELGIFIRAIGYEFDVNNGKVSAKDINKLFKQIEGKPEENLIKVATIRSMAKAVYSTKNIGHFGLAFKYYTHFTSPIRRYPDMMVHRMLKNHLKSKKVTAHESAEYSHLAIKSSEREVEAVKAERDSIKYKQVEYMKEHIGEEFTGIVSGVTEFGIFVEEVDTKSEGLIRMSSISGDYFTLDQKNYSVIGERSKKKFALGDKVKIKLKKADLENRTLDFELVP